MHLELNVYGLDHSIYEGELSAKKSSDCQGKEHGNGIEGMISYLCLLLLFLAWPVAPSAGTI